MLCIYTEVPNGGPVMTKTPEGLAVIAFATPEIAKVFLSKKTFPYPVRLIQLSQLGSNEYPIPANHSDLTDALLIGSIETLTSFVEAGQTFQFIPHLVKLPYA